jgi:hypothetical protein
VSLLDILGLKVLEIPVVLRMKSAHTCRIIYVNPLLGGGSRIYATAGEAALRLLPIQL